MSYDPNDPMARMAFLLQAEATITDDFPDISGCRSAWNFAIRQFIAADLRARAQDEFGPHELARQDRDAVECLLKVKHGTKWAETAEGKLITDRHRAAMNASDQFLSEHFYEPHHIACRLVAMTPAPTLAAAIVKAAIVEIHETWHDPEMTGDTLAILDADIERFAPREGGEA